MGFRVFLNCTNLTEVNYPKNWKNTPGGNGSYNNEHGEIFYGCTSLKSIRIPEGVTTVAEYAFANGKSLTEVIIPESVTECSPGGTRSRMTRGQGFRLLSALLSFPNGWYSHLYSFFSLLNFVDIKCFSAGGLFRLPANLPVSPQSPFCCTFSNSTLLKNIFNQAFPAQLSKYKRVKISSKPVQSRLRLRHPLPEIPCSHTTFLQPGFLCCRSGGTNHPRGLFTSAPFSCRPVPDTP